MGYPDSPSFFTSFSRHPQINLDRQNFFGKMKNEMFYGHEYEFKSLDKLKKAMEEYIAYYNTERIQVRLKGLTPCEARSQALKSN